MRWDTPYESDEVYRFLIQRLKKPGAQRSFLQERYQDAAAWSEETRTWVRSLLLYAPDPVDFAPQLLEKEEFSGYTRLYLTFYTAPDCKATAYLLLPKGLTAPAPAVVALHDHSGRFYWGKEKLVDHKAPLPGVDWLQQWRYGGRGFASALAERGYVVLVMDSLGWGDRGWLRESWLRGGEGLLEGLTPGTQTYIDAYDEAWRQQKRLMEDAAFFAGTSVAGIQIHEDMRSVDFLRSLPEVDAGRIGCMGLSMGGFRAVFLAALHEGIRCCCPVGYMARMNDIIPHRSPSVGFLLPGLYDALPYPDVASLILPRDLLVLTCENDRLFELSSMEAAVETIRQAYAKADAPARFAARSFPVGHQFDRAMQTVAFDWLDACLLEAADR